ncbi:MAG: tetraacyldisaccharide 4'-kinase, partial [Nitrospiria bacterium]
MIPGLNPYGIGEASRITMQREGASLKNATRPGRPAERFLKWVWDKKGGTADLVLFPLTLFAWLYGLVCRLRPFLYEKGFLPRKRADAFIVSVGNLTVGGTGKTPFTIYLAETWREKGYSVGIVSRGYGRNDKRSVVLVSDGEKMLEAASAAGDEPYLMAERLKGIPVVVSADRFKGCQWLIRHFKMDLILLDDAFQHVPIHRDMNLLLIDAMNPYGNHRLLPRGPLREPLSAARRADLVIFTRSE